MDCYFCRRQREDQPSMACVHGRKSEDVPQEGAVSSRIFAIHDHVRTKDHKLFSLPPIIGDNPSAPQANTSLERPQRPDKSRLAEDDV
jgi:hypothetical protein